MAFCRDCWRRIPARPKGNILKSWDRVQRSGEDRAATTGDAVKRAALSVLEEAAGITVATDLGPDAAKSLYKRALTKAHPDHGGNAEQLALVQDAGRKLGVA